MSRLVDGGAGGTPRAPGPARPAAPTARRRLIHGEAVGLRRPIALEVRPAGAVPEGGEPAPGRPATPEPPREVLEWREAARLQGYDEGYEEGYTAGLAAAEMAMAAQLERLAQLAASAAEDHAGFYRSAERQVVELALQVAQKVVEREVENVPDLAVGVIRAALEEMDARTVVRVRVSPEDHEVVRRRWAVAVAPSVGGGAVELVVDPRVQGGGAVIETTQGQVDAQLETKLAQLGNALWAFSARSDQEPAREPPADA